MKAFAAKANGVIRVRLLSSSVAHFSRQDGIFGLFGASGAIILKGHGVLALEPLEGVGGQAACDVEERGEHLGALSFS
ncbi:hypothetical protein MOV08_41645 [Streptomyces yunnanensis]|uniref:Uncharacterized protein n=1 Tax=Streptomyces yunnanensis TaxID=156453 RepID=A0ABY8AJE5_9ACTN|nr:hypothetical protein [Streptomyces yunnanensis]WEB45160.1 hypothetical protein MOV08_41645 [Streptomyces yunnanensis]